MLAQQINGSTKIYGLIGSNISNTLSPAIHNAAFSFFQLNSVYIPLALQMQQTEPHQVLRVLEVCKMLDFGGLNITMPYKEVLAREMGWLDQDASATGSINTIHFADDTMQGYNTDVYGFTESLRHSRVDLNGADCLIVGAGGAAKSVARGLSLNKVSSIVITARNPNKAKAAAETVKKFSRNDISVCHLGMDALSMECLGKYDFIVNATPIGMQGYPKEYNLQLWSFFDHQIFYDLLYHPEKTHLMSIAERAGCRALGGLDMLIYQGIRAFQIWTGDTPSYDLIYEAIQKFNKRK